MLKLENISLMNRRLSPEEQDTVHKELLDLLSAICFIGTELKGITCIQLEESSINFYDIAQLHTHQHIQPSLVDKMMTTDDEWHIYYQQFGQFIRETMRKVYTAHYYQKHISEIQEKDVLSIFKNEVEEREQGVV